MKASLAALGALLLAFGASAQEAPGAHATLNDAGGRAVGEVTLAQFPQGVMVKVELKGAPPGAHGFHIHAVGQCAPPFASAGGHFNPTGRKHGMINAEFHAGDLPNLFVAPDGAVIAEIFATSLSLDGRDGKPNLLTNPGGASFILHAKADDYKSDPAGDSGDRIACGVIGR